MPEVPWQQDEQAQTAAEQTTHRLLQRPLTAATAAQIALLHNRELQATLASIGLSRADLLEAGQLKNPSFEGSARFPSRPPSAVDLEGAVAFDFLDLFLRPLRRKVAQAELTQTELRAADAVLKLTAEAKTAFYGAAAQAQLTSTRQRALEAAEAALDLTQRQEQARNIPELQVAMRQAAVGEARLALATATAEARIARERLNRVLGLWGTETDWKLAGDLSPVPAATPATDGLERVALTQRLDFAAARLDVESLAAALGLAKKYRYVGGLEFGLASEQQTDRQVITGPTLRLELPIFQQGQARLARGEARLQQAVARLEALAVSIRSEVREQRDLLSAKREQALLYRDQLLPGRQRISGLILLQYNAMLLGVYDLLEAKERELETERGSIETTRDYWIAQAELERALGGSLTQRPSTAKPLAAQHR